ncbi:hypothetical protein ACFXPW_07400 [Streptomyces goshikiensis]|uniref:hypothetical protein n=1 Tax=Streptomyces goshikiensis TaxID=1942 RepID=UPI0036A9EAB4
MEPRGHLGGWCRPRCAVRGFRLDRVRHVEVLAETVPSRALDLAELDTLGWEFIGLDELHRTDGVLALPAWSAVATAMGRCDTRGIDVARIHLDGHAHLCRSGRCRCHDRGRGRPPPPPWRWPCSRRG